MAEFSHIDDQGKAVMVDITGKPVTERVATACGAVSMSPETVTRIVEGGFAKGDVLAVARLAGIMGAKQTANLIPLCHPLALSAIDLDLRCDVARGVVEIEATCRLAGRTGVEMEALTAVSVAALTIYDMCKAVERGICIGEIRLVHKEGGRSGAYRAET